MMQTGKSVAVYDIDALLFDLGGVVIEIDFERAFILWAQYASCSKEIVAKRFSTDLAYERHERGEITSSEYFSHLRSILGINITDHQFLEGWNAIFVGNMPGITATLSRLSRRLPLYIFSNSNQAHEQYWSRHFGQTLGGFTEIFVSSTIGMRKPEAAAYDHVVNEIDRHAKRIVFFDDLAENVDAARVQGLMAFHVTDEKELSDALLDLGLG